MGEGELITSVAVEFVAGTQVLAALSSLHTAGVWLLQCCRARPYSTALLAIPFAIFAD